MAEYRLSARARADLLAIYQYTDATHGRLQAEKYHAGFERAFGLIAENPEIGASANEIVPGIRRFRHEAHIAFYTVEPDHVLIRAIVHGRQGIGPRLLK